MPEVRGEPPDYTQSLNALREIQAQNHREFKAFGAELREFRVQMREFRVETRLEFAQLHSGLEHIIRRVEGLSSR